MFNDRYQAGEMLSHKLEEYRDRQPLILAVPRGGVMVAELVWEQLGGQLDLMITRKIGAPHQPELAIGAVSGDGYVMINDRLVSQLNISDIYISEKAEQEKAEIERRMAIYRGDRPLPVFGNNPVILIDDGVATGYTLLVALRSLQQKEPKELILAVPVGPPDTFDKLKPEADRLVYLESPAHFAAVGQFYHHFNQVSDSEVIAVLTRAWNI